VGERPTPPRHQRLTILRAWQRDNPLSLEQSSGGLIKPQFVIDELWRLTGDDAVFVAGVGQHQMWASQFWRFQRPHPWVNSGGLGTMGLSSQLPSVGRSPRPRNSGTRSTVTGAFR